MKSFEQKGERSPEPEKEKGTWVQDVSRSEAEQMIITLTDQLYEESGDDEEIGNKTPQGSKYDIGPSKSGKENEVGIYFFDPTAQKEKE